MTNTLSKFAKFILIINVIFTILIFAMHVYSVHRMNESYQIIDELREERSISRDTAIRILEKEGVDIYIEREFTHFFGVFVSFMNLILCFQFYRNYGLFIGFATAFTSMFTSFIGGLLIFYLIFSGRVEVRGKSSGFNFKDEWEHFIHKKSDESKDEDAKDHSTVK